MDVDVQNFLRRLDLYDDKTLDAAGRGMNDNVLDLQKLAMQLVPVHKRGLIGTAYSRVTFPSGEVEGQVGFNKPYAVKVHEDMEPAPGATQRRGPLTRAKPGNEFGEAGGKYLQRPLRGKSKVYMRHLADKIKKVK